LSVLVAFTVGLVFWIVAWALGIKAFDAFLVTLGLTLIAATAKIMAPFLNRLLKP
jgi:Mn2+/Fe2+ NRAMP family transporter